MSENFSSAQVLCWNCEEVVHRYAATCPYCQKDLKNSTDDGVNPVASIPQAISFGSAKPKEEVREKAPFLKQESRFTAVDSSLAFNVNHDLTHASMHIEEVDDDTSSFSIILRQLIPLICLLSGTFFFFFGVLIRLFSENGVFVLQWNQASWPYLVFPALAASLIGFFFLPRMDDE